MLSACVRVTMPCKSVRLAKRLMNVNEEIEDGCRTCVLGARSG